jgi:hypothetical protein
VRTQLILAGIAFEVLSPVAVVVLAVLVTALIEGLAARATTSSVGAWAALGRVSRSVPSSTR